MSPSNSMRDAFLRWGYLQADLDPLGRIDPIVHPELAGLTGDEAKRWRRIYCGSLGVELAHVYFQDRCEWVAERMEAKPPPPDRERLVGRLAQVELFERFLPPLRG